MYPQLSSTMMALMILVSWLLTLFLPMGNRWSFGTYLGLACYRQLDIVHYQYSRDLAFVDMHIWTLFEEVIGKIYVTGLLVDHFQRLANLSHEHDKNWWQNNMCHPCHHAFIRLQRTLTVQGFDDNGEYLIPYHKCRTPNQSDLLLSITMMRLKDFVRYMWILTF